MKKTVTTTEVSCDVCGRPCIQDNRKLLAKYWADNNVHRQIDIRISFHCDYATSDGDVCDQCAIEALEEVLQKLRKRTNEPGKCD